MNTLTCLLFTFKWLVWLVAHFILSFYALVFNLSIIIKGSESIYIIMQILHTALQLIPYGKDGRSCSLINQDKLLLIISFNLMTSMHDHVLILQGEIRG